VVLLEAKHSQQLIELEFLLFFIISDHSHILWQTFLNEAGKMRDKCQPIDQQSILDTGDWLITHKTTLPFFYLTTRQGRRKRITNEFNAANMSPAP